MFENLIFTGVARLSSARVVRCLVHSFNERNSYFFKLFSFKFFDIPKILTFKKDSQ